MGNRAFIIVPNDLQSRKEALLHSGPNYKVPDPYLKPFRPVSGVYVQWNGGIDSVAAYIAALRFFDISSPLGRPDAYYARLVQVIGNFLSGNMSVYCRGEMMPSIFGPANSKNAFPNFVCDNYPGDNGVFVFDFANDNYERFVLYNYLDYYDIKKTKDHVCIVHDYAGALERMVKQVGHPSCQDHRSADEGPYEDISQPAVIKKYVTAAREWFLTQFYDVQAKALLTPSEQNKPEAHALRQNEADSFVHNLTGLIECSMYGLTTEYYRQKIGASFYGTHNDALLRGDAKVSA